MKTLLLLTALSTPLCAADPKESVIAAANKLNDSNYSWVVTTEAPSGGGGGGGGNRFTPGPVTGKTEKGGFTTVNTTFGDNTSEVVLKGGKWVMKTEDGWQTGDEMRAAAEKRRAEGGGGGGGEGRGRGFGGFLSRRWDTFKTPAATAADLAGKTSGLKEADGAISGDLTAEAATELLTFGGGGRRGGGGGDGQGPPAPTNPKGSVKFSIKDGALTKVEVKVEGTFSGRDGNERTINRTTVTEIKDAGSTKVEPAAEAKSKLEGGGKSDSKKEEAQKPA